VLVKVVRVIANISITEVVGPQVAASKACIDLLIRILGELLVNLSTKTFHLGPLLRQMRQSMLHQPLHVRVRYTRD